MDEIYNLYVRGDDSSFHPIPALKGDKGDNGENGKFYYTTVVLQSSLWSNSGSPYTQTLDVEHVTANSCVNICPSYTNISAAINEKYTLAVVNNNGIVTFYAIGNKPVSNISLQVQVAEVYV